MKTKAHEFIGYCTLAVMSCVSLYLAAYLVAAQRFETYCGSRPIDDPTWSLKVGIAPNYRFLNSSFWSVAHQLDLQIRPDYWTFTLRSSSQGAKLTTDMIGRPVFNKQ
jgi:hypothetical protein